MTLAGTAGSWTSRGSCSWSAPSTPNGTMNGEASHAPAHRADETTAFAREVRESAASQLQVILDHVKDAILTVDDAGRIETLNSTAERVFGCQESAVRGRRLDLLIPSLARRPNLTEALSELAESLEDTQCDLAPRETKGRRVDGTLFDAELGVSHVRLDRREMFVVCLRDTTDRKLAEAAIRDSEARYRTLVENAPETIVVLDVDLGRFVECNENAVRFFKMSREELLAVGPERISPPVQSDGNPSFGAVRGHLDRALGRRGSVLRVDALRRTGHVIPCEVRLVRLPSSGQRLIRGSITDITERKRSELLAAGERRVFERITSNVEPAGHARGHRGDRRTRHAGLPLRGDHVRRRIEHASPRRRPPPAWPLPEGRRTGGSRASQRLLRRRDFSAAPGGRRRDLAGCALGAPARAGSHGRIEGLLVHADPRLGWPHAGYRRPVFPPAAQPVETRLRADGAPHGAGRHRDRAQAHRAGLAPERGPLPRTVRERHRGRLPHRRRGRLRIRQPGPRRHARLRYVPRNCSRSLRRATFTSTRAGREVIVATLHRDGMVRNAECQLRRRDGTR